MFNKNKKITSIVLVLLVLTMYVVPAFAYTTKMGSTSQSFVWCVGNTFTNGYILSWYSAYCKVIYAEDYSHNNYNITFNSHSIFAYAEDWNGGSSNPLYVYADSSIKYYIGKKYQTEVPVYSDTNVIVSPKWIWDKKMSDITKTVYNSIVVGEAGASFMCPNAYVVYTPSTKSIFTSLVF